MTFRIMLMKSFVLIGALFVMWVMGAWMSGDFSWVQHLFLDQDVNSPGKRMAVLLVVVIITVLWWKHIWKEE